MARTVVASMRVSRLVLGVAGAIVLAPPLASAQQARGTFQPIHGCHAGISCRPLGYSVLKSEGASNSSLLFGAGIRFGPGISFFLLTPFNRPPEPPPVQNSQMFHLGKVSFLAPEPEPTPTLPTPPPSPAPPASPTPPAPPETLED